jgi:hypothetical protein
VGPYDLHFEPVEVGAGLVFVDGDRFAYAAVALRTLDLVDLAADWVDHVRLVPPAAYHSAVELDLYSGWVMYEQTVRDWVRPVRYLEVLCFPGQTTFRIGRIHPRDPQ